MRRAARRVACAVALALLASAATARAEVADYLGKRIVSIRLAVEGRDTADPALVGVLETAVGRPLAMADVRESITHLYSLGRFDDVRVDAAAAPGGVAIRFDLTPIHPVTRIEFDGRPNVPGGGESYLRRALAERGGSRAVGRATDMARTLADALAVRGYLNASVVPRAEVSHDPDRTTLVFTVTPGPRAIVGMVSIVGTPGVARDAFLKDLGLAAGAPYERDATAAGVDRYVADRRRHGYYEARVTTAETIADEGRTANVTVTVADGPHVRVAFAGDGLPAGNRADLVPVEREGSVDEDLLEDSSHGIEELLRAQGYRDAAAPYTRELSGAEMVVSFRVSRGPLYRVERVDISGNASVPLADFESALRVRDGTPFADTRLDGDVAVIADVYRRRGFAAVKVDTAVDVQPASASGEVAVVVRIAVREGPRTLVGDVRFVGNRSVGDAELRSVVKVRTDQPFVVAELAADRDGLEIEYANRGFGNAVVDVRPEYDAGNTRANVVFTIREGVRVLVDHVLIVGNERTSRSTIERELQLHPGDPLGREAMFESQRRLAALGLFRRVVVQPLPQREETRRDLLVSVEEAPVTTIAYGGGAEGRRRVVPTASGLAEEKFEFAPRASFEIGRRNVLGTNGSANLFTSIAVPLRTASSAEVSGTGPTEYRAVGTFREPRALGATDALLNVTAEQQVRSSFNYRTTSASAELARRVTRAVSASASYQIQRTDVFDVNVSPSEQRLIDRAFTQLRVSSFSGSLIRDTRDDQVEPGAGEYFSANGQLAGRAIGSEVGFVKSFFRAQAFRTLPHTNHIVFAANASVGLATGFPREDANGQTLIDLATGQPARDLPESERFYAGGDTTVRGFALDTLGVRHTPPELPHDTIDADGFPLGGNALMIFNGELRLPATRSLGVHGFVDTGNVFARATDIDLSEFRTAVGFGVYYKSPVGPIRVDLGFKVHPQPGEALTAWFVTFGQAF